MNTLEIAKIMNKKHSDVIRDLKRVLSVEHLAQLSTLLIWNKENKRSTKVYEMCSEHLAQLTYKDSLFDKLKIEKLENKIKELEKETNAFKKDEIKGIKIEKLENEIKIKDRKINQLENALLAKEKTNQKYIVDNYELKSELNDMKGLLEESTDFMVDPKGSEILKKILKRRLFPKMNIDDYKTGRNAFHPDKTKRQTNNIFIWFDMNCKKENALMRN